MDFRAIKSNGDISKAFSGGEIVWIGMDDVDILLSNAKRDYRIYIDEVPIDNDQIIKLESSTQYFFYKVRIPKSLSGYDNLVFDTKMVTTTTKLQRLEGYEETLIEIIIIEPESKKRTKKLYLVRTRTKKIPTPPPPRKRS